MVDFNDLGFKRGADDTANIAVQLAFSFFFDSLKTHFSCINLLIIHLFLMCYKYMIIRFMCVLFEFLRCHHAPHFFNRCYYIVFHECIK